MAEYLRSIEVTITADTNKRTVDHTFTLEDFSDESFTTLAEQYAEVRDRIG